MALPAYKRAYVNCLPTDQDKRGVALEAAEKRRKRLNKESNDWCLAIVLDLLFGAGPWIVGTCAVASALWAIHENVDGAPATYKTFDAPAGHRRPSRPSRPSCSCPRSQANLACNSTIVTEFNNLTGSLINLALWVKSQMVRDKRAVDALDLPDGSGGCYRTNQIGMTLASVPYAVKYVGRGVDISPRACRSGRTPTSSKVQGVHEPRARRAPRGA